MVYQILAVIYLVSTITCIVTRLVSGRGESMVKVADCKAAAVPQGDWGRIVRV